MHEYLPGASLALVTDGAVAVLHPAVGADVVRDLWELARTGSRLSRWVEYLAGGGIRALPSFAIVEALEDGTRVLVRGDLTVRIGDRSFSGASYATWKEEVVPGGVRFEIEAGPGRDASWLPAVGGILYADAVRSSEGGLRATPAPEEEDLESTLMRAPALAAAGHPPGGSAAGDHVRGVPVGAAHAVDGATTGPDAAEDPGDVAGPGVAEDYDHLLWSTEQQAHRSRPQAGQDVAGTTSARTPPPPPPPPALEATRLPEPEDPTPTPEPEDPTPPTLISSVPGRPAEVESTALPTPAPPPPPTGGPAHTRAVRLRLSTGTDVLVDRPVLLGRAPEAGRFRGDAAPRLVSLPNPERDVSGTHLEVRPAGDGVVVTDMGSTNGTVVSPPDGEAFRLRPGTGVPVAVGTVVELGAALSLTVEQEAGPA